MDGDDESGAHGARQTHGGGLGRLVRGVNDAVCNRMPLEKALGLPPHWRRKVRKITMRSALRSIRAANPDWTIADIHRLVTGYVESGKYAEDCQRFGER